MKKAAKPRSVEAPKRKSNSKTKRKFIRPVDTTSARDESSKRAASKVRGFVASQLLCDNGPLRIRAFTTIRDSGWVPQNYLQSGFFRFALGHDIQMKDFDDLYREHAPAVYRMSMRYVGRSQIAEEIVSENFLALHEQFEHVDQSQLPAWLFTVAKRRAIDYWRRQEHEESLTAAVAEQAAAPADKPDVLELIRGCGSLKPMHRACVLLRYLHGMSRSEIAARTGLDESQVKGHLQYALKLLKQELAKSAIQNPLR